MAYVNVDSIKPMNDDVVLIHHSINEDRLIYMKEDEDKDKNFMFRVLRVSEKVKHVKVGEIVIVPWPRCVPPFPVIVDGVVQKITITSEMEILGVMDYD